MSLRGFVITAAVLTLLCAFSACSSPEIGLTAAELREAGDRILIAGDFEQALLYFTQLVKTDASDQRGYTGAAEARIGMGQSGAAIAVLQDGLGVIPGNTGIQSMLDDVLAKEPPDTPVTSLPDDSQGDWDSGAPGSDYAPPLAVPGDVLEASGRISEALITRDFEAVWEMSSNVGILSFLRQVLSLGAPAPDSLVFKYGDAVFTLVSPELPGEYEHFASEYISVDSSGGGVYIRFSMNTYGSYEYPTYEVFTVTGYELTGDYELYCFPGGVFNDDVLYFFMGQVVNGRYEGVLTREVRFNHGGVTTLEEDWSGGENPGYYGGPFPVNVSAGYIQYIAGLPNWQASHP